MDNNFTQGQKVICISEDFPLIRKYSSESAQESKNTPKKDEVLVIDEILGEFLRFDKYDTLEAYNWWKHDRFREIDEFEFNKYENHEFRTQREARVI